MITSRATPLRSLECTCPWSRSRTVRASERARIGHAIAATVVRASRSCCFAAGRSGHGYAYRRSLSGELAQLFLHGPAEGDEAVALLGVQVVEPGHDLRLDRLGPEGLVVERRGVPAPVAPGQEGPLVVGAGLDAVALGQAAAP